MTDLFPCTHAQIQVMCPCHCVLAKEYSQFLYSSEGEKGSVSVPQVCYDHGSSQRSALWVVKQLESVLLQLCSWTSVTPRSRK